MLWVTAHAEPLHTVISLPESHGLELKVPNNWPQHAQPLAAKDELKPLQWNDKDIHGGKLVPNPDRCRCADAGGGNTVAVRYTDRHPWAW